jgi:hypothetical protein
MPRYFRDTTLVNTVQWMASRSAPAVAFAFALLSCTAFEPDSIRTLGFIAGVGCSSPQIDFPDTVQAGVDFNVRVNTFGGGCHAAGDTEFTVEGFEAVISPYDIERRSNICTTDLRVFEHEAIIRFGAAGTGYVTVRGRMGPGGGTISVRRAVIVE